MSKKPDFSDDLELVACLEEGGYCPFNRSDNVRAGKLQRSAAYAAMKEAYEAKERAYRAWVSKFGTDRQRTDLRKSDEAKEYLRKLDAGEIVLPPKPIDGRTAKGRALKARSEATI